MEFEVKKIKKHQQKGIRVIAGRMEPSNLGHW